MTEVSTAAIIAGGQSRRMGVNKALLTYRGNPLIRHVAGILQSVFTTVVVSTSDSSVAEAAGAAAIPDIRPGAGPLSGIHACLATLQRPVLCVGCDMPFLNAGYLEYLWRLQAGFDAVVPRSASGLEPLHAVYTPKCLPHFEQTLDSSQTPGFEQLLRPLNVLYVEEENAARFDPALQMFVNWNVPDDVVP